MLYIHDPVVYVMWGWGDLDELSHTNNEVEVYQQHVVYTLKISYFRSTVQNTIAVTDVLARAARLRRYLRIT